MSKDTRPYQVSGLAHDVATHGGATVRVTLEPRGPIADGPLDLAFGLADWALLRDAWRPGATVALTAAFAAAFRWPR